MARVNILRRKMLRDMRHGFPQFITIFLMLTIGMMAYSGIRTYMAGMDTSIKDYYVKNNLQALDAFGEFNDDTLKEIRRLPHVKRAEAKLSLPAKISNLKDYDLQLNFIQQNSISKFHVAEGQAFDPAAYGIWLDAYFAKNNHLKVGDRLNLKAQGQKLEAEILGLIYTPDHVAYIKDGNEIFPTHDKYGYAYLSYHMLPAQLNKYSSIMIQVDDVSRIDSVKAAVSENITGITAVIPTKEQYSAASFQGEIDEAKTYVGIFSTLFIAIALLCVVTTMARLVHKDRMQIGALKALGFTDGRIARHYISYTLFIAIFGTIIGLGLGYFCFANYFLDMQMSYFELPNYHTAASWDIWLVAIIIILATCLTCYLVIRGYVRQPAAEILRVERPKVNNRSLRLTNTKLFSKISFSARWNIRDMLRNQARTCTTIVGIVGCMILLVCGFGIRDTMNHYVYIETQAINHYKYRLNLSKDIRPEDLTKLMRQFSHRSSKTLPIEIRQADKLKISSIFINDSDGAVSTLDKNWQDMQLPVDGVLITRKLAANMGYEIGQTIEWHVMGEKQYYHSKIVGFSRDPQNQNITMTRQFYESLGRHYLPDSIYADKTTKHLPEGVASIQDINNIRDAMNMMLYTMMSMVAVLIVFAVLLAVVIIYNMGILSLTEKNYQFATLKVLGFSDYKIARIFIQQNLWISVAAIIAGLPIGYAITDYIFKTAIDENYDFTVFVTLATCLISSCATFIISLLVSGWLARRIRKIDMVTSLKANE